MTGSATPVRVAVIGGGVSGIASAGVLTRTGFDPVIYERADTLGGIWARSYPAVRLQNSAHQYHLADLPWPVPPDEHPTALQIRRYFETAVEHFGLDLRCGHRVEEVAREADGSGWRLRVEAAGETRWERADRLMVAAGQYSGAQTTGGFEGAERFGGEILTEREIDDLAVFEGRRVAVVGFGKTAVDFASFAASRADRVVHVFRTPRWLIPKHVLGLHFSRPFFARASTAMMPCWSHALDWERRLHAAGGAVVAGYWRLVETLFSLSRHRAAWGAPAGARERLAAVAPAHSLVGDLRSALALAPDGYFDHVAEGAIEPRCAAVERFVPDGLALATGERVECDLAVLALGTRPPTFPFFAPELRAALERHEDGLQLYRHLVHPALPDVGFAGFNHGFLHLPAVEMGTLWTSALWRGDLTLPAPEVMEREIETVRSWKRAHVHFEPSRSCAVSTRFQQHLDLLLRDLGLRPYRKLPNLPAELLMRYGPLDYAGLVEEYEARRERVGRAAAPLQPLALAG